MTIYRNTPLITKIIVYAAVVCISYMQPLFSLQTITTQKELEELFENNKDKSLVVKFGATWCPSCTATEKIYHDITEKEAFKHIVFAAVSLDSDRTIGGQYVRSIPTVLYFLQGKKVDETVGSENFEKLVQEKINQHLMSAPSSANETHTIHISSAPQENSADTAATIAAVTQAEPAMQTKEELPSNPPHSDRIMHIIRAIIDFIINSIKHIITTIAAWF